MMLLWLIFFIGSTSSFYHGCNGCGSAGIRNRRLDPNQEKFVSRVDRYLNSLINDMHLLADERKILLINAQARPRPGVDFTPDDHSGEDDRDDIDRERPFRPPPNKPVFNVGVQHQPRPNPVIPSGPNYNPKPKPTRPLYPSVPDTGVPDNQPETDYSRVPAFGINVPENQPNIPNRPNFGSSPDVEEPLEPEVPKTTTEDELNKIKELLDRQDPKVLRELIANILLDVRRSSGSSRSSTGA